MFWRVFCADDCLGLIIVCASEKFHRRGRNLSLVKINLIADLYYVSGVEKGVFSFSWFNLWILLSFCTIIRSKSCCVTSSASFYVVSSFVEFHGVKSFAFFFFLLGGFFIGLSWYFVIKNSWFSFSLVVLGVKCHYLAVQSSGSNAQLVNSIHPAIFDLILTY